MSSILNICMYVKINVCLTKAQKFCQGSIPTITNLESFNFQHDYQVGPAYLILLVLIWELGIVVSDIRQDVWDQGEVWKGLECHAPRGVWARRENTE